MSRMMTTVYSEDEGEMQKIENFLQEHNIDWDSEWMNTGEDSPGHDEHLQAMPDDPLVDRPPQPNEPQYTDLGKEDEP